MGWNPSALNFEHAAATKNCLFLPSFNALSQSPCTCCPPDEVGVPEPDFSKKALCSFLQLFDFGHHFWYFPSWCRDAVARHPKIRIPVEGFSHCMGFLEFPRGVFILVSWSLHCPGSHPFLPQKSRFFKSRVDHCICNADLRSPRRMFRGCFGPFFA